MSSRPDGGTSRTRDRPGGAGGLRAFLRAANGLGSRVAEDVWTAAASRVRRRPGDVRRWTTTGRERVLVIAAHPDDEAMGCAGSILRHRRAGDAVQVVIVTDGSLSRAYGLSGDVIAAHRRNEAREAAARMDVASEWVGLEEGRWTDADGSAAIRGSLRATSPTIVYAPSAIDYHPEHRRVAAAVAAALTETGARPEVRIYAVQVPLTSLLVNLVHDVSDIDHAVRRALAAYATQRESIARTLRLRRYAARVHGGGDAAEAFCAMPAALFCELHRRPPASFRPLRIRAWTDPLAAVMGTRERIAWRRRLGPGP
ncbi:MAG TPA: PIG-L family deacetylase [Thermoanaerobaculia bacterium]|nr:PIG-L family deacetylase [Thermoanaerobaculia bacterium]